MVLVLAVVVIGVVLAVAVATGLFGDNRRGKEEVFAPTTLLAGAGVVGIVVVLSGAAFLVIGVGGPSGEPADPATTRRSSTAGSAETRLPPAALPPAPVDPGPPLPTVVVPASDPNRFASYEVLDALRPDSVARIQATGFEPFEGGQAQQCVSEVDRPAGCTPPSPVQFGNDGRADFQYQLRPSFAPGACRAGTPTCTLRVSGTESGRTGSLQTVFVDEVTAGLVTVEPNRGISGEQQVVVSVSGFPAEASLVATVCAAPGAYDPRRCRTGDGTARFRTGPDGSGRTGLVVGTGDIGIDRIDCGPRGACGVTVVSAEGFVASPTIPISFSLGPGADYASGRLAAGLAVAALLVAVALALIRRTDWRGPTEAAAPAVDGADLQTDLTLDELFGSDEELDTNDPVAF